MLLPMGAEPRAGALADDSRMWAER